MTQSPDTPRGLEELAGRCDERATDMANEADLLEVELASHEAVKDARWHSYETNKNQNTMFQWRMFFDRMTTCQSNLKMTRADEVHYRACAAALRSHIQGNG